MAKVARKQKWHAEALRYLQAYQQAHLQALCSLPALYSHLTAKSRISVERFHAGLRELVHTGQVRLHPFSGPRSALERAEYALVVNNEIMYYAEWVDAVA